MPAKNFIVHRYLQSNIYIKFCQEKPKPCVSSMTAFTKK